MPPLASGATRSGPLTLVYWFKLWPCGLGVEVEAHPPESARLLKVNTTNELKNTDHHTKIISAERPISRRLDCEMRRIQIGMKHALFNPGK